MWIQDLWVLHYVPIWSPFYVLYKDKEIIFTKFGCLLNILVVFFVNLFNVIWIWICFFFPSVLVYHFFVSCLFLDIGISLACNHSNSVDGKKIWLVFMVAIFIDFQIHWWDKQQWLSSVCCLFTTKIAEAITSVDRLVVAFLLFKTSM